MLCIHKLGNPYETGCAVLRFFFLWGAWDISEKLKRKLLTKATACESFLSYDE